MLPLAGSWTIDSFSRQLDGLDLFGGAEPGMPAFRDYRRWAFESAAADLALRQAGRSLADVLGREPQPIHFVVSLRLGEPPSAEPVDPPARRLSRRCSSSSTPRRRGTTSCSPRSPRPARSSRSTSRAPTRARRSTSTTDPDLYRRCAETFPEAWLEDPDLTVPEADEALRPHRDRITWDAPIHGVADIEALPFLPRTINVKPSRIGTLAASCCDTYEWCAERGIINYGGGQSELGVGRGQIQYLAVDLPRRRAERHRARRATTGASSRRPGLPANPLPPRPRADRVPPALVDWISAMAKQRQVKMEQKGALAAMQQLESRSDEELEAETRYKAAAQAILGARAAERMDAKRSREHFRVAIAAARPQERLQLRRMAEASLALAERRAGDLKVAAEKLGQTPPTEPPAARAARDGRRSRRRASAGILRRIGGILLLILAVVVAILLGWAIVKLIALPFGGIGTGVVVLLGLPARLPSCSAC